MTLPAGYGKGGSPNKRNRRIGAIMTIIVCRNCGNSFALAEKTSTAVEDRCPKCLGNPWHIRADYYPPSIISPEQSAYLDHLRDLEQFRYRTKEARFSILSWVMGSEWMRKGIDTETLRAMEAELKKRIEKYE